MKDKTIKTKEEARQYAVDYQKWESEQNLSWSEVIDWSNRFYRLGKKFGLTEEFRENGIL